VDGRAWDGIWGVGLKMGLGKGIDFDTEKGGEVLRLWVYWRQLQLNRFILYTNVTVYYDCICIQGPTTAMKSRAPLTSQIMIHQKH